MVRGPRPCCGGPRWRQSWEGLARERVGTESSFSGGVRQRQPPVFTRPFLSGWLGWCPGLCGHPPKEMPWAPELILGRQVPWGKDVARNGVPGFHHPHSAPSLQHLSSRSPSSRLGRLPQRAGEPQAWASGGVSGDPGRRRASRLRKQWQPRESQGPWGTQSVCQARSPGQRRAPSRGPEGQGGPRARGQAELQKQDSGPAQGPTGSFWLLVGLVGADSWAEVGWGLDPPAGMVEGVGSFRSTMREPGLGPRPQGRKARMNLKTLL